MKNLFRWRSPARSDVSQTTASDAKSTALSSMFALSSGGIANWSQTDYGTLAHKGYMSNPIVYRCVRLISQSAAAIPLLAYDDSQEVTDHPILQLMKRPNSQQAGRDLMETLIGHLQVSGNAFVEMVSLNGEPKELHALRPDRVRPICDESGWTQAYEYKVNGHSTQYQTSQSGASPILHIALFHPLDDQMGFPPLRAALMALDVHSAASRWNKALLDNSARPSGALVYSSAAGDNLTAEQFSRLKSELEEGYTGASRAGRPLLLEGGLDWKAMGYSPKDMDFVDARNVAAREIALAFGVPPMLLGIPGDNTYSNYQEANRAFVRQAILPLINRIVDAINHWAAPHFNDGVRLAIDEDGIEALAAERSIKWKQPAQADFLTDDEKREALGYSPRDGQ